MGAPGGGRSLGRSRLRLGGRRLRRRGLRGCGLGGRRLGRPGLGGCRLRPGRVSALPQRIRGGRRITRRRLGNHQCAHHVSGDAGDVSNTADLYRVVGPRAPGRCGAEHELAGECRTAGDLSRLPAASRARSCARSGGRRRRVPRRGGVLRGGIGFGGAPTMETVVQRLGQDGTPRIFPTATAPPRDWPGPIPCPLVRRSTC